MDAYQFLSNGEAQPVPFGRSGVVALIHPLKDMGEISGGNPFPVISHYDFACCSVSVTVRVTCLAPLCVRIFCSRLLRIRV